MTAPAGGLHSSSQWYSKSACTKLYSVKFDKQIITVP